MKERERVFCLRSLRARPDARPSSRTIDLLAIVRFRVVLGSLTGF